MTTVLNSPDPLCTYYGFSVGEGQWKIHRTCSPRMHRFINMIRCRYESLDYNRNEKHMPVLGYSLGVSEEKFMLFE